MTISQPSSSDGSGAGGAWSGCAWGVSWARALAHALACRSERRRAAGELRRLAQVGDHLLRDIGIDPKLAREEPSATAEHLLRRR